ncbi:DUF4179 domain-containing protein [Paenibacillus apiarius]|uniref:DUF4179 domain-containing protein n=1 Tax=Paenibacillus apiarius TaxID=46240 RepID=UPI00197FAA10|nr:DUF4179 domain-containing protein [Paenibacillus apiarius]MBN3523603.1 DUF4179 domain-containing protein [Paenibacillus apiarius]
MESKVDEEIRQRLTARCASDLPDLVKTRLEETLQSLDAVPVRRKTRNRKPWLVAAAAILIIGGTLASGFVSPVMAETLKKVPFIGQIFETLGDEGLQNANRKGLSAPAHFTAADQGITLTITEVLYDGVQVVLGIQEESENALPALDDSWDRYEIELRDYYADVSDIWTHKATRMISKTPAQNIGILKFESVHGLEAERDAKLPDEFTVPFSIKQVGEVSGNWEFNVPVKINDSQTQKILPEETKQVNNGKGSITLQSVISTPLGTEVRFQIAEDSSPDKQKKNWSGWNSSYILMDENGYIIPSMGGKGGPGAQTDNSTVTMEFAFDYAPLPEHAKKLIFKPYYPGKRYGDNTVIVDPNALPVTVQQGEIGSITIRSIAFNPDKTVLHFDVEGNSPEDQTNAILLIQDGERVWYRNKLLKVENGIYSYVMECDDQPLQKDKEIKFYTSKIRKATFFKELEFEIPLQ